MTSDESVLGLNEKKDWKPSGISGISVNTQNLNDVYGANPLTPVTTTSPQFNLIISEENNRKTSGYGDLSFSETHRHSASSGSHNFAGSLTTKARPGASMFCFKRGKSESVRACREKETCQDVNCDSNNCGRRDPIIMGLKSHSATMVGNRMFVFGGCLGNGDFSNEMYYLDTDTLRWSLVGMEKEMKPPPMKAHTVCHIGKDPETNHEMLLLFGGGCDKQYYNDVFLFDTRSLEWRKVVTECENGSEAPDPRRGHSMVHFGDSVYIFGGGTGQVALNDTYRLCLKTFKWKRLQTVRSSDGKNWNPPARGYHSATVIDSKMIIYGGCDGSNFFSNLQILDLNTLTWHTIELDVREGPMNRFAHSTVQLGTNLLIQCGIEGPGDVENNHEDYCCKKDSFLLNLTNLTFEKVVVAGEAPPFLAYQTCCITKDQRLLMFGGCDGVTGSTSSSLIVYELAGYAYLTDRNAFTIELTTLNK